MTLGDILITIVIGIAFLAIVICIAVTIHRGLTAPPETSEYDEFWRRKSER